MGEYLSVHPTEPRLEIVKLQHDLDLHGQVSKKKSGFGIGPFISIFRVQHVCIYVLSWMQLYYKDLMYTPPQLFESPALKSKIRIGAVGIPPSNSQSL